jgi:hypothetical protein
MVLNFDLQLLLITLLIFHVHSSRTSHYTFENSSLPNIMSCWIQKPCPVMKQMSKIEQFSSTFVYIWMFVAILWGLYEVVEFNWTQFEAIS